MKVRALFVNKPTTKSIRDTFLYKSMNKSGITDKTISNAIKKGIVLTPDKLSYEFNTMSKLFKYADKEEVLKAYEEGILKPVVLPQGLNERLTNSIPFMLGMNGRQVIAYVGTTGNSTGNHLHFEVQEGGSLKQPLTYVSR